MNEKNKNDHSQIWAGEDNGRYTNKLLGKSLCAEVVTSVIPYELAMRKCHPSKKHQALMMHKLVENKEEDGDGEDEDEDGDKDEE